MYVLTVVVRSEEQLAGWAKGVVKAKGGTMAVSEEVKDVVVVADAGRAMAVCGGDSCERPVAMSRGGKQ